MTERVIEKTLRLHHEFVKENGHEPRYASVKARWYGGTEDIEDIVKLKDFNPADVENDADFENVLFLFEGVDGLCYDDESHGFVITDVVGFSDNY